MINYFSKFGKIFFLLLLIIPLLIIYNDSYFLLAYIYTAFSLFLVLNQKRKQINIITLTFLILYLQSFFIPLYYYALFQKLDIWFEYINLDLLSSDKLAHIMFLINTTFIGSVFLSKFITPYENKLLSKIKLEVKDISFYTVNTIFNILIVLLILSSIYSISTYYSLGTTMYDHTNLNNFSRFILLIISPSQLTIVFFVYYFIALVNNYNVNRKAILVILIISLSGMLIGTRSTLLIMLVTLFILFHYTIKINYKIYISFIKNRQKIIIIVLLLILVLIVTFYVATVLRVFLYREHEYASLLEMVSNEQYSSFKRIIARLSYIDVVSLLHEANEKGYSLFDSSVLDKYFNIWYELKVALNMLVPGDIFPNARLNLGELFRAAYFGASIDQILEKHQSYVPTLNGYIFSKIYPYTSSLLYFLYFFGILSLFVSFTAIIYNILYHIKCYAIIKIISLYLMYYLYHHLYILEGMGILIGILYQKIFLSLFVCALVISIYKIIRRKEKYNYEQ